MVFRESINRFLNCFVFFFLNRSLFENKDFSSNAKIWILLEGTSYCKKKMKEQFLFSFLILRVWPRMKV